MNQVYYRIIQNFFMQKKTKDYIQLRPTTWQPNTQEGY